MIGQAKFYSARIYILSIVCALILFPAQYVFAEEGANPHCSLIHDEFKAALQDIKASVSKGETAVIFYRHEIRPQFKDYLKPCGEARSICLKNEFKKNGIEIAEVFSTDYGRTKQTAVLMTGIESPTLYKMGADLKKNIQLAEAVQCANADDDAGCGGVYLVIAHSTNLAGMLNLETIERREDADFKNYKTIHYIIKPAQTELDGTKKYPLKTATNFHPASKSLCK
ncbi:MAG: hypothetical protein ACQ9MH_14065 [Nitrospinales bacterium]